MSTKKRAYVYRVRYPYGHLIVDKGKFTPPCADEICPDCRPLVEESQYSHVPLALLLDNPVEVFIDYPPDVNGFRFAPLRVIPPGELFGVFEVLDLLIGSPTLRPSWSLSSGSRSVWILAPLGNVNLTRELSTKISEATKGQADITWEPDESPHWKLIQECTLASQTPWFTDVIVFPGELIRSLKKSSRLFNELLSIGWHSSSTLRHSSIEHPTVRNGVAKVMRRIALPGGEMHHHNAILHFMNVITGALPAYRSCHVVGTPTGPFLSFCDLLNKALTKLDRSRPYRPIVMEPHHLAEGESGFYSCRCPSLPGVQQERPETYLSLMEGYRDVISSFKGDEVSEIVNSKSITLFSPASGRLPRGITSLDTLALKDFVDPSPSPTGTLSTTVYLKSQFLVSCMRLTRATSTRSNATAAR